jgi:hypothetical protein
MLSHNNKYWLPLLAFLLYSSTFLAQNENIKSQISAYILRFRSRNAALKQNTLKIENLNINNHSEKISISFSKSFEVIPFRPDSIEVFYDSIRGCLPDSMRSYAISAYINGLPIEDFVPNFYRKERDVDADRNPKETYDGPSIVENESKPFVIENGLNGRHIALWNSHGWYYDPTTNTWQWQRPRLFSIVEDTYTTSIVLPYLVPMLENAGACTFLPRERDIQKKEVVVDNDDPLSHNFILSNSAKDVWEKDSSGFANTKRIYWGKDNPFKLGTYLKIKSRKSGLAKATWIPNIPSDGNYAVYVSYKTVPNSVNDAQYSVYHSGGTTKFSVNQRMGSGTWIYLGTFHFKKGRNEDSGKVELTNSSKHGGLITADAVRFGGGMGNIGRYPKSSSFPPPDSVIATSGRARYLEGARYWLQWAGFSDSIYSPNHGNNEYKDDYMSRGLWVNALAGGSIRLPNQQGLNIPLDLAMALHTDAGISKKGEVIGSMAIYMTNNNAVYDNQQRRMTSRDLADLIQTQTVDDIQSQFYPDWTRRKLTDESYYEARVPQIPTMLFEFLSHQNFRDMQLALDPRFRFTVARSIYKGILKYISSQYNTSYVVQPLPVVNFSAEFLDNSDNQAYLSWNDQIDSLENTAVAQKYILYTSIDNGGFDNGQVINDKHAIVNLKPGIIYNFKVTAINSGGESFPSETLSMGKAVEEKGEALIVNGFDRVAAPAAFETDQYEGFIDKLDPGVPDHYDISYTGSQYDFAKNSPFVDNENPGVGASYSNYEGAQIAGNTFDFSYLHGKSILNAGYSFASCSAHAFEDGNINTSNYLFIDLILGKQKTTITGREKRFAVMPQPLMEQLDKYLEQNGNLLMTGEYIASDIFAQDGDCDSLTTNFVEEKLHYTWGEDYADCKGTLSSKISMDLRFKESYDFFTEPNSHRYFVDNPDILRAVNGGTSVLKYDDTQNTACVMFNGKYKTIVSAIPFETIKTKNDRDEFMQESISFFEQSDRYKQIKMITLPAKSKIKANSYTSTNHSIKQDVVKKVKSLKEKYRK